MPRNGSCVNTRFADLLQLSSFVSCYHFLRRLSRKATRRCRFRHRLKCRFRFASTAEDIDYDGGDGKLEFSSASSVRSLAAFFRTQLKPLGWKELATVINRANMAGSISRKATNR